MKQLFLLLAITVSLGTFAQKKVILNITAQGSTDTTGSKDYATQVTGKPAVLNGFANTASAKIDYTVNLGSLFSARSLVDKNYNDSARNKARDSVVTLLAAKQNTITLTTTGATGAATLVSGTLNIPNYAKPSLSKSAMIESPSSIESIGMWHTSVAITVDSVVSVLLGASSPSVTFNVWFGADRTSGTNVFTSSQTVASTTTGLISKTGFNDNTIPAGSFIWIVITAKSGDVWQIEPTINFKED